MSKRITSSNQDEGAPMTPEQKETKKQELLKEVDKDYGVEDNASAPEEDEPQNEESDSTTDEVEVQESSDDTKSEDEEYESESEDSEDSIESDLTAKEKRYKEQLLGEKKAALALQAKVEALEAQLLRISQSQQLPSPQQLTSEEQQLLDEKKLLREKYGVVVKEDYEALEKKFQQLLDDRIKPIKQEREQKLLTKLYKKYPDIAPEKDLGDERWNKVNNLVKRILPANQTDPLADFEERFDMAYGQVFGAKPKPNRAKIKEASYTSLGGGVSSSKTKTVEIEDKYAHLSPEMREYKKKIDAYIETDSKRLSQMRK